MLSLKFCDLSEAKGMDIIMKEFSKKEKVLIIVLALVITAGIGFRVYRSWTAPAGKGFEIIQSKETVDYGDRSQPGGEELEKQEEEQNIIVHVAGAVNNPGVYTLVEGSRVFGAIEAAGGFSEEAQSDAVNLAAKLHDGQQVYVPREGEEFPPAAVFQGGVTAKINLNTATQDELEKLPGIGPAKAQAIIQERQRDGPFKSIEEITRVSGIGDKTLENLRDLITI